MHEGRLWLTQDTVKFTPGSQANPVHLLSFCVDERFLVHMLDSHWRELPQVSFLSRQSFAAANTSFVATKVCLWRQNVFRDKIVCRDEHKTRLLSRQNYASIIFVATNILLSQQRTCFVVTNTCFCRNKNDTCDSPRQWYWTTVAGQPILLFLNDL